MIDQPAGPPFLGLPVRGVRQELDDVGADDPQYHEVLRYLDSCAVVLTLGTPWERPGGGLVREYRCDGVSLWDDVEHHEAMSRPVFFARTLVERAGRHHGVGPRLSETTRDDAVAQILAERGERQMAALEREV